MFPSLPASTTVPATQSGEGLAALPHPDNAGANRAEGHIKVFTAGIEQPPADFYEQDGQLIGEKVLVRTDRAGTSMAGASPAAPAGAVAADEFVGGAVVVHGCNTVRGEFAGDGVGEQFA